MQTLKPYEVRPCRESDLPTVLEIFNDAIVTTTASWAYSPVELEQVQSAYRSKLERGYPYLVAASADEVLGYASLGPFRERDGYRFTVENSVYVHRSARGQGIARALMDQLISLAADRGYHSIVAAMSADNLASKTLHESIGFEYRGVLPELGFKFDRWLDLAIYQLMLDSGA